MPKFLTGSKFRETSRVLKADASIKKTTESNLIFKKIPLRKTFRVFKKLQF